MIPTLTAPMRPRRATGCATLLAGASLSAACTVCTVCIAQPAAPLADCIAAFRKELPQHPKVSAATFDERTKDMQDLRPAIEKSTSTQPEFKLAIWDYLAKLADAGRAADGRRILQTHAEALAAIQRRLAVDPATVVAVFGVETDYGNVRGRYPVIDATLSRACLQPANAERKGHFFDALWLVQEGLVQPELFMGSWAGAFGLTQFMPGTFVRYLDDADGSGKADIIGSVPDALGTTANFLRGLGWVAELPWGVEVSVSPQAAALAAGEQDHACLATSDASPRCKASDQWATLGVRRVDGKPLPSLPRAALLAPAGAAGPAWLITPNYQAIWRYNRADSYALAIGLLSDALRGQAPQQTPWPTDDPGLSREQFRQVQGWLAAKGYPGVTADGFDGPMTQAAVRAEEKRLAWRESGRAGMKLFNALLADASSPVPASAPAASAPSS